jgi:CMP-2-keto-3-deoxyoctulosonic acid synthetase
MNRKSTDGKGSSGADGVGSIYERGDNNDDECICNVKGDNYK